MPPIVDNYTESEKKKYDLINLIQDLHKNGNSIHQIAKITGKERRTVRKYLTGDPDVLCRNKKHSHLDGYTDYIIKEIMSGKTASSIAKQLKEAGRLYNQKRDIPLSLDERRADRGTSSITLGKIQCPPGIGKMHT